MPTRDETKRMVEKIRWARSQLENVTDAIDDARSALRDAEALIGALADEIAEMKGAACAEGEE
jgi:hypothetical protein